MAYNISANRVGVNPSQVDKNGNVKVDSEAIANDLAGAGLQVLNGKLRVKADNTIDSYQGIEVSNNGISVDAFKFMPIEAVQLASGGNVSTGPFAYTGRTYLAGYNTPILYFRNTATFNNASKVFIPIGPFIYDIGITVLYIAYSLSGNNLQPQIYKFDKTAKTLTLYGTLPAQTITRVNTTNALSPELETTEIKPIEETTDTKEVEEEKTELKSIAPVDEVKSTAKKTTKRKTTRKTTK